jgi:hypothetical protein
MLVGPFDELWLDETVRNGKTAIGIPRNSGVDDVGKPAKRDLGDVVRRIEILATSGVVRYQALGELALVVLALGGSDCTGKDENNDWKKQQTVGSKA